MPANGANPVGTQDNISITFSEPVNVTGTWFTISCATSGAHTATVTGGPTTFTLNPDTDFVANEVCTVTVLAAQVTDQDANDPPDNMAANKVFSFTTDVPPSVTTTIPAANATDIAQNATITVNFSESVAATTSSFTIVCTSGGTQAFNLSASPSTSFILTPTALLPAGDNCTVTVIANQISDTDTADPPDNMVANFPFTFKVKPDAVNDTYPQTVIGNVSIDSSVIPYSVTTNDVSANAFTISAFDANTPNGGQVAMTTSGANIGKFTYNPPPGFEGTDTFNYTISRTDGGGTDTATVSIPVSGMVWFIDNTAASCTTVAAGCGRLSNRFSALSSFNTANGVADAGLVHNPAANDNIFIYESATPYTGSVTLLSGQKLIGQDATATLASVAGVTVGSGSAALPAMNSGNATVTNVNASVTQATNSQVIGLDMDGASAALTGSSITGFTVNMNRFRRTAAGVAVSLAGSGNTGNYTFKSLSATGTSGVGNKGVIVNNLTGTFTVLGTDSGVTPNGGTVSGYGSNGMEFNNVANGASNSVSLTKMTISGNGISQSVAGSASNCGGDLATGNNQSCVANVFLQTTTKVVLDTVTVSNSGQQGINGNAVNGLTITNSTITGNGNEGFEDGILLQSASGTIGITGSTIQDNEARQMHIGNLSGTMTLNTSSSSYGRTAAGNSDTQQGILLQLQGTSISTINASSLTFANNIASAGGTISTNAFQINADNGGPTVTGSIKSSSFDNDAAAVLVNAGGTANVTFDTMDNLTMTRTNLEAINYTILGGGAGITGKITGTISGNNINGCTPVGSNCHGIDLNTGTNQNGEFHLLIDNNTVQGTSGGVTLLADGATNPGTGKVHLRIIRNSITNPIAAGGIRAGINLEAAGSSPAGANISVCTDVGGAGVQNTVTGNWGHGVSDSGVYLRQRFSAANSWVLPGYGGTNSDTTAVQNYINGRNTISGAMFQSTASTTTGAYTNGSCTTPLLLAAGGVESAFDALFVPSPLDRAIGGSSSGPNHFGFFTSRSDVASETVSSATTMASTVATSIDQRQLDSIVSAAIQRWSATGLTPHQLTTLRGIKFEIADLQGAYLGEADGNRILVDTNAQGKGWFIDANPLSDSSFARAVSATRLYTDPMNAAAGHVDLLTAIEHEMGHRLGLDDSYAAKDRDSIMYGYLTVGERRLPAQGQAQNAKPGNQATQHLKLRSASAASRRAGTVSRRSDKPITPLVGGNVNQSIGTLPAGKSVTITFQVTLNTAMPGGTSQVSTQGKVFYTGGPVGGVLTDDTGVPPNTGETDPTVTPIDAPTAADSTVSGRILDNNGNPVEGAVIRLSGTQNRKTITDADGNYNFTEVETNGFYTRHPIKGEL